MSPQLHFHRAVDIAQPVNYKRSLYSRVSYFEVALVAKVAEMAGPDLIRRTKFRFRVGGYILDGEELLFTAVEDGNI